MFFTSYTLPQVNAIKKAHIRGLLNAFKVPSQLTLKTQQEVNEQSSRYLSSSNFLSFSTLTAAPLLYHHLVFQNKLHIHQGKLRTSPTSLLRIGVHLDPSRRWGSTLQDSFTKSLKNPGAASTLLSWMKLKLETG